MKYEENMESVAALQPDYLGFIFYDKSSRFFDTAIPKLPKSITKTGVFVDEKLEVVLQKIKRYNLQAVQLHGNESPEYCKKLSDTFLLEHKEKSAKASQKTKNALKKECQADLDLASQNEIFTFKKRIELIKVFSIKNEFNFDILKPYEGIVDYFLFDTKGKLPGGNGYTFNWDVLKDYPSTTPYFLSGGIGLNEIENIKAFNKSPASKYCYAIDVNSKFEVAPGLKDINELKKFKEQLRVKKTDII